MAKPRRRNRAFVQRLAPRASSILASKLDPPSCQSNWQFFRDDEPAYGSRAIVINAEERGKKDRRTERECVCVFLVLGIIKKWYSEMRQKVTSNGRFILKSMSTIFINWKLFFIRRNIHLFAYLRRILSFCDQRTHYKWNESLTSCAGNCFADHNEWPNRIE